MELQIKGQTVLIDDDDFGLIQGYGWCIAGNGYVIAHIPGSGHVGKKIYLHRLILGCKGRKPYVDHLNGNPLDNRRSNIRTCTQSENMRNRGPTKANKLGIKGISYSSKRERYEVRIMVNYKTIHVGRFKNLCDAVIAHKKATEKYHGQFAKT